MRTIAPRHADPGERPIPADWGTWTMPAKTAKISADKTSLQT